MTVENPVSASVSIRAEEATPRLHCTHKDGNVSVALTPQWAQCDLYVRGTPLDLLAFSRKLEQLARDIRTLADAGELEEVRQ